MQSKALHFDAAAQYRKANEELENKRYDRACPDSTRALTSCRYDQEIGRLQSARKRAKEGSEIARKGGVSASVLNDLTVGADDWVNRSINLLLFSSPCSVLWRAISRGRSAIMT